MKGLLIALAAILALSHARPQGVEFTAKEYAAFQQLLGDRIPVAIQSAIRVLAGVESNPTDFVVLNFNGLSGATARTGAVAPAAAPVTTARTGAVAPAAAPVATGGVPSARTRTISTDDDVAETFSEVANDAVEEVQEVAEEATEEANVEDLAADRIPKNATDLTPTAEEAPQESPEVAEAEESLTATSLVANSFDDGAVDITSNDPTTETVLEAEADETAAVNGTSAAVEENTVDDAIEAVAETPAEEPTETALEEAAVRRTGLAAEAAEEVANEVTAVEAAGTIEAARRKRQFDSQDDNRSRRAQELALALSALGGLYVRRV